MLPTLTNFVVVFRFRIEYQHVYHSSGGTRYFGHFYVCGSEKILDFSCTVYKYVITIIIIIRALMLFFQFPFFLSLVSEISLSKIKLPHIRFFVIDKSGNFFSFSQWVCVCERANVCVCIYCPHIWSCFHCFICRLQPKAMERHRGEILLHNLDHSFRVQFTLISSTQTRLY